MPDLIPQKQVENAKLFSSRDDFIKTLPKKISYLEAGVLAGDFSLQVIEEVHPIKAYLVDPFFDKDWRAPEFDSPRWEKPEDHFSFVQKRFKDIQCVSLFQEPYEFFIKHNNEKFDFIYLDYDTDHHSIQKQLFMSISRISDSGIIGFNDYNIYFNNTTTGEKMGVVSGINEFLRNNPEWYVHAFALNDNLTSDIYLKRS